MSTSILNKILSGIFILIMPCISNGQDGIVRGKVSNETGVLPGATISVGNKIVIADINGEFLVANQPGNYIITVTHAGYVKIEKEITVVKGVSQYLDFILQPLGELPDVIVLGSRSQKERSRLNTPVPIDIVKVSNLPATQVELTKVIVSTIPSFNAPAHGFGTGKHVVPASLRGLGPDQTLVLLNGRRLHSMAIPWTQGVTGFGSVGTDINAITPAAIETIEVLRDGAAAQYGSDAIAGVVNLQLKRANRGTSVQFHTGQYYKGDGESVSISVNQGTTFFKKGFLNLTAQLRYHNNTQRNGIYQGMVYYNIPSNATPRQRDSITMLDQQKVIDRGFDRKNHRPIGDNRIWNSGIAVNGGLPVSGKLNIFWTAVWNGRFVHDQYSSSAYRYPKDSTTMTNTRVYPDGFLPKLESKIPDLSLIAGLEGHLNAAWKWDASITYGRNSTRIDVTNSSNASQYLQSPNVQTEFYTGKQSFSQLINNVNFRREIISQAAKSFNIAFGTELRIDRYVIAEGEEASWQNYAPASGRLGGSQGLAGFRPENAVSENRHVAGAYAEFEMEGMKKLLLNVATRYEYYSDFGSNLAGKFSFRYKFLKQVLWRGSVSNGFRAPSLQQRYYSLITTANTTGNVTVRSGTFRNDSEIARAFGISSLGAEKALNFSSGFTSSISKNISLTIDAYWLQIKNRIIYSGNISGSLPEVRQILINNNFNDIQSVRFFSNAINTRTKGLDIVLTANWTVARNKLQTLLAANLNKTTLYGAVQYAKNLPDDEKYRNLLVNREERCRVEDAFPRDKLIFNISYLVGKWDLNVNFTRYGKISQKGNDPVNFPDEIFSPKVVSGVNVNYKLKTWISFTAGAENIFNVFPDKLKNFSNTATGLYIYNPNFAVFGCNGGYYFITMAINLLTKK